MTTHTLFFDQSIHPNRGRCCLAQKQLGFKGTKEGSRQKHQFLWSCLANMESTSVAVSQFAYFHTYTCYFECICAFTLTSMAKCSAL